MLEHNARPWKVEDLQKALQSNFRLPVAAASQQYNIPYRIYKIPERKLERNVILSSTAEEILNGTKAHLQQMGFGVTRKQVRPFAFKICEEKNILGDIYLMGGIFGMT
jgi:hypothetical protein